tara:strand:+ start:423 stop:617 length:195 start_codon:yes stop_codon:yes gene_type:complete
MISGCSDPTESRIDRSKKNFDEVMNEVSNLCLEKGYKGHEPEYRGCAIQTASTVFNIKAIRLLD